MCSLYVPSASIAPPAGRCWDALSRVSGGLVGRGPFRGARDGRGAGFPRGGRGPGRSFACLHPRQRRATHSSRRRRPPRSRMCGGGTVVLWTSASPSATYQERTASASASRVSPHPVRRSSLFTMRLSADNDWAERRTRAAPATSVPMVSTSTFRAERSARYWRNASSSRVARVVSDVSVLCPPLVAH